MRFWVEGAAWGRSFLQFKIENPKSEIDQMRGLLPSTHHVPMHSRAISGGFLLVVIALAAWVGFETVRLAVASEIAATWDVAQLERALALDPENPEIISRLGRSYFYSTESPDTSTGLKYLREAAQLSRYRASYWVDYGVACDADGNLEAAQAALRQAVQLAPNTPRYHWLLANHYLKSDRQDDALREFGIAVRFDPDQYARSSFSLCLKTSDSPDMVFRQVVTDNAPSKLKLVYAEFLCEQGQVEASERVWSAIVAKPDQRPPFPEVYPYLLRLQVMGRFDSVQKVWQDLERVGVIRRPADDPQNLIFNGGFEQPPLDGGFDWYYSDVPYLRLDFSDSQAYQGKRCLRIDFTVPRNEEYAPVYTLAPVEPGRTYHFQAYARSENISSQSGPGLRVVDASCWSCLDVSTAMTVGTTPWHPLDLTFTAGPKTKVVQIMVWRPRGRVFPPEISGSFWVDAVSLKAVAPGSAPGEQ